MLRLILADAAWYDADLVVNAMQSAAERIKCSGARASRRIFNGKLDCHGKEDLLPRSKTEHTRNL